MKWTKKDLAKRIRFSRSEKKRTELLEEIEGCNKRLRELYEQHIETTPIVDSWRKHSGDHLLHVSEHAGCLYTVLRKCWQCQCCAAHDTLLRLEQRPRSKRRVKPAVKFKLLFASKISNDDDMYGGSWQQMEIRVIPKR